MLSWRLPSSSRTHRDALLQKLKEELSVESPGIRVLCPTRWTVRAGALHSIQANYDVLQCLWTESLDIVKDAEMRGRILGVATYIKNHLISSLV